ncbi:MAG: serine/threonine protein kinase [Labilithrix sp.]|nr:serine/threonine protein kinase [Labilithrix sp.]
MTGGASRYETLVPIGSGGMATVFVGRSLGAVGFKRLVALKRAHPHVRDDERLAASMKREAHLASRLHHANVVSVLDVEEVDGDLMLVLDYVEGCTLRSLAAKLERLGERRPREMLRILLDVAAGLHAAHHATDDEGRLLGLVHRDVTPSNVLVGVDGVSRLSDFGIAKVFLETSDQTETGVLKGKTSYMAPEYVTHQRADASSDLFSFAVVAWEALAGTRLFRAPTDLETLKRVARADAPPLSKERPELAALDAVFRRALARRPADRQANVEAMASELEVVARAHDLVGSHAEVSALVERLARPELEERRRHLRADADTIVGSLPLLPASSRDEVATASVGPIPGEALDVGPSRLASSTELPRHNHSATSALHAPRDGRKREIVALAGALLLLLLGLAWLWTQLRTTPATSTAAALGVPSTAPPMSSAAPSSSATPREPTARAMVTSATPLPDTPPVHPSGSGPTRGHRPRSVVSTPTSTLAPRKAPPNPYQSPAQ